MKKKMKNLISTFIVVLLTIFAISIPTLLNKKTKYQIDEKIITKTKDSVCRVEDIYYNSLQEAINSNSDNSVIEIISDINETIKITSRAITIEGNGYKISANKTNNNLGVIDIKDSTVCLRNMDVEGNGELVQTGLHISSSNIYLENIQITNFTTMVEELPKGIGVYFLNENTESTLLFIKNSVFKKYSSAAIFIDNKNKIQDEIIPIVNIEITDSLFEPLSVGSSIGLIMIGNIKGGVTNNEFKNMKFEKSYGIYQNTDKDAIFYSDNYFYNVYQSIYQQIKK